MAVRRPRKARRPRAPRQAPGTYRGLAAEGDDLGAAAEVIADEARRLASWSRQVPGNLKVEVSGDGRMAVISADAGPAYPNEVPGVKHPTFGHRPWVTNKHRPFLGPAADATAGDAMTRYAEKLNRMLAKAGFR